MPKATQDLPVQTSLWRSAGHLGAALTNFSACPPLGNALARPGWLSPLPRSVTDTFRPQVICCSTADPLVCDVNDNRRAKTAFTPAPLLKALGL